MSNVVEQMAIQEAREVWGILGGMGPLASAEFMRTIYEQNIGDKEQNAPVVFLLSDPTIPDRTESLRNGTEEILLARLSSGIRQLIAAGASRVVICCVTIHFLLPRLPASLRAKIISLIDLIFMEIIQGGEKSLLLCTRGTQETGIFQAHEAWPEARKFVVLPDGHDQECVHQLIYEIKNSQTNEQHLQFVESLMHKYKVRSYIAGCTELHILARELAQASGRKTHEFCIDPLAMVAEMMHAKCPVPGPGRASMNLEIQSRRRSSSIASG